VAERAATPLPRVAPLVAGLVFVVLGGGALLLDAGVLDGAPLGVVAAALVVGGVTALVLVVAGAARRPGSPP
jgi:hypothetical protein